MGVHIKNKNGVEYISNETNNYKGREFWSRVQRIDSGNYRILRGAQKSMYKPRVRSFCWVLGWTLFSAFFIYSPAILFLTNFSKDTLDVTFELVFEVIVACLLTLPGWLIHARIMIKTGRLYLSIRHEILSKYGLADKSEGELGYYDSCLPVPKLVLLPKGTDSLEDWY